MQKFYRLMIALIVWLGCVTTLALPAVAVPSLTNVSVQSGAAGALDDADLGCTYDLADGVAAATAWYRNSTPLARVLLPIEGGAANGLLDLSGNNNTMTAVGNTATAWQPTGGRNGTGAYAFGASFYINAGPVFPTSSSYTKAAWVKRTGAGSNNILSSSTATGGHVLYASGSQGFRLSAGQLGSYNLTQDPDSLVAGVWYHVAVTFDYATGMMILYKDGAVVDTATVPADRRDITDPNLQVGAFANSSQWAGLIDEARLYDFALTPEQILALYHDGDSIASTETVIGDQWYADVTPFSATEVGTTVTSNTVLIAAGAPDVSGIPDQTIPEGSSFATIDLDSYVTDPNNTAAEMTWSSTGSVELSVSIVNRVATITVPNADWNGAETIIFRATDPTFLYDEDTALFTVTPVDDPPLVGDIPDQAVPQGTPFTVIDLDTYVSDIDNDPSEMTWTASGQTDLIVTIDNFNRTATIDVPGSSWYGAETITFRATDPDGLYAEDAATFSVDADPGVESVVLSATAPNPLTDDDLSCSFTLTGNASSAAVAWQRNGNPDMVLYLPTEGGAAAALLDYSGHGYPVTTGGNPVYDSTGSHDGHGAWVLDGNDHLSAGSIFPTQSSYTITVWLERTGSGSNNILSGASSHVFFASSSSQQNHMAAGHNGNFTIVRDPDSLDLNVWYFAALTFDYASGEMILYKDGVEVDRGTATPSEREMTDAALFVGAFAASSQWRGALDDIRVYDRALSPEQVVKIYTGENTIVSNETVVLDQWRADVTPFSGSEVGPLVSSNTLLVGYLNHPPVLDTILPHSIDVGDPLSFSVSGDDEDPQPFPALTTSSLPTGASFADHGDGTGTFDWTPDYDQFGDFHVTFYAVDDSLATDSQEVVITVIPDITAPGVTLSYPDEDSLTVENFMQLGFDVSDENPMQVRIWGGTDPTPTQLIHVDTGLTTGPSDYLWEAPVVSGADPGVRALWLFNEADGVTTADSSANGNDGTIDGAVWTPDGFHGYALEFDGLDDYVTVPDAPSLDIDPGGGALTIEAWVFPEAAGNGSLRTIVAKRAFSKARTVNYELLLNFNRNLIFGEGQTSTYLHLSTVTVPADTWSHVAFTLDASTRIGRFYLNGVLADSLVGIDIGPEHDEPLYIGASGPSEEPFMGKIDDLRLSDRALSPFEIRGDYLLTQGAYYWQVEVEDASGNVSRSEVRSFAVYDPQFVDPAPSYPVIGSVPVLYDLVPEFAWTPWVGPSPYDTVYYRLHLTIKRDFSFEAVFDSIPALQFQWVDSLAFGKQYWWRVDAWVQTDSNFTTTSSAVDSFWTWTLGDITSDHARNVSDLTALVQYLFTGGAAPTPLYIADLDQSCSVNVSDLTYLVAFLFQGGADILPGCE